MALEKHREGFSSPAIPLDFHEVFSLGVSSL